MEKACNFLRSTLSFTLCKFKKSGEKSVHIMQFFRITLLHSFIPTRSTNHYVLFRFLDTDEKHLKNHTHAVQSSSTNAVF